MQPEQVDPRARPRWVFRGDDAAWDVLADTLARAPDAPVPWPIAPSGPSMDPGDRILLWRSGRGGGIAASGTVLSEPDAVLDPDGHPRVTVEIRIDRALRTPLAPLRLLREPELRPLAFMDVLDATELRLSPAQQTALERLFERDEREEDHAPGEAEMTGRTVSIEVPAGLRELVEELLVRLGARDPHRMTRSGPAGGRQAGDPTTDGTVAPGESGLRATPRPDPTDSQQELVQVVHTVHGRAPFTVDAVAVTWRTGVGTARSRIERLLEVGLLERAGTLRPEERSGVRPTRGRPPVLYRLAAAQTPPPATAPMAAPAADRSTADSTQQMES
jgi:hypothetical protein